MQFLFLWLLTLLFGGQALAESPQLRAAPDGDAYVAAMEAPLPEIPAEWKDFSDPYATVYAHPSDQATALHLSRHVARALPRIAQEMGLPIGNRIHIYLAPDQETFLTLQPARAPHWADGTAYPHHGLIFLRAPRVRGGMAEPLEQVLDHELAHIVLGRAFGPKSVPRWLQEGMAQLVAREYTAQTTDRLGQGMLGGELFSAEELTAGFPADPLRAQLAYAQSADLVAFLLNTYGQQALHTTIREMAAGKPFGAALRAATGLSVQELDAQWRGRLASTPMLWLRPLVSDTMLLSGAALLFVGGGVLALRRKRLRFAEMAAEEQAVEAWYTQLSSEALPPSLSASALPDAYLEAAQRSPYGPH